MLSESLTQQNSFHFLGLLRFNFDRKLEMTFNAFKDVRKLVKLLAFLASDT